MKYVIEGITEGPKPVQKKVPEILIRDVTTELLAKKEIEHVTISKEED